MKKLLFGASLMLIAVGISSCGKVASPETFEFTLTAADFSPVGTSGTSDFIYAAAHPMSAITADVVSTGAILGYMQVGTQWAPMPYMVTATTYVAIYSYTYEAGTINITRKDTDLNSIPPSSITVKIVVVSQKNMPLLDGVDRNNYQAVSNALNLSK